MPLNHLGHSNFSFPDSVLLNQIQQRMIHPQLIDQGYTNLCGMASCAMLLASFEPETYQVFTSDLFFKGHAQTGRYRLTLKPRIVRTETNYFSKGKLPAADWLLLASMRNKCNLFLGYGGNMPSWYEKMAGSNFPADLRRTLRLMGFPRIKDNMGGFWPVRKPASATLSFLQNEHNKGNKAIILINTRMYHSGKFSLFSNHFAVFNGQYQPENENGSISFNIWTFGYANGKTITCTPESFRNNYFGCMIVGKRH